MKTFYKSNEKPSTKKTLLYKNKYSSKIKNKNIKKQKKKSEEKPRRQWRKKKTKIAKIKVLQL